MSPQDPKAPRYDAQGRLLCRARRRGTDELCRGLAMQGSRVCRIHGGTAPQTMQKARLRLLELIDPAITTLAREMATAERSGDKQRAANSLLDRAGVPRVVKSPESDVARALLIERLRAIRGDGPPQHDDFDDPDPTDEDPDL